MNDDGYDDLVVSSDDAFLVYYGYPEDDDGDGYTADVDCDDGDPAIGLYLTWHSDADGDGYGDPSTTGHVCDSTTGYVEDATDCDDTSASVHPGATESCDGVDDDCDGAVDESGAAGETSWYLDADGDGYGDPSSPVLACAAPSGRVTDSTDCDDASNVTNPSIVETCDGVDDDCDGLTDEPDAADASTWYLDADGDGFGDAAASTPGCTAPSGYVADATDCDDASNATNPSAVETCDAVDDDCDGLTDEPDAAGAPTWYRDADSDGFGDPSSTAVACTVPSDYVADSSDCDDSRAATHPFGTEYCNGHDDDCDGLTDGPDAADASTWYLDADGDGFGDPSSTTVACTVPSGYVADATDCDDASNATNPSATESCDGVDDDCDGAIDEAGATGEATWYRDADADGYGTPSTTVDACDQPSGYVATSDDCDDARSGTNPGAAEWCGGGDEDCDGTVDEPDAEGTSTLWYDGDGDGYGSARDTFQACSAPSGYVDNDDDCDDTDPDAGLPTDWFTDADGDGHGSDFAQSACTAPQDTSATSDDCDDADPTVNPSARETWYDGTDQDCDGNDDDQDGDGRPLAGDCDDEDPGIWEGCVEDTGPGGTGEPTADTGTGKTREESCGCSAPPNQRSGPSLLAFLALGSLVARRRRAGWSCAGSSMGTGTGDTRVARSEPSPSNRGQVVHPT